MEKFLPLFLHSYRTTTFENNFIPALISYLLRDIDHPKVKIIRDDIAKKLLANKKENSEWNYDETGRYPNDLDDTFTAFIALHFHSPEKLDGQLFSAMTRLLKRQEVATGGPYKTWMHEPWPDVDTVVNSTIHYFLSLYKIDLPTLTAYIDTSFESKYYTNPIVKYYFISRSIKNKNLISKIQDIKTNTLLYTSLKLSSLIHLGESVNLSVLDQDLPLGNDLYLDKGNIYAGCDALTYAFCLETLSLNQPPKSKEKLDPDIIINELCDPEFSKNERFQEILKQATTYDKITALGWTAYSLLDDVADGDMPVEIIFESCQLLCEMYTELRSKDPLFVKRIFRKMHCAILWEIKNCRDPKKLPRFKKHKHHSGYKSFGFALQSSNKKSTLKYYREFLELKQLNDDAHDWKEDFDRGHVTLANISLFRRGELNILGTIARYKMHIKRLRNFEITESVSLIKEATDKYQAILNTLEREHSYFHITKSVRPEGLEPPTNRV